MARTRRKTRVAPGDKFVQLFVWLLQSEAWQATTVYERALYLELKRRYNGGNNGDIPFSHREAEAALNCSNKPVKAAFEGLIKKGFIRATQVGSFKWKTGGGPGGRSTRWLLTEYQADLPVKTISPDRDFMRWKPGSEKKTRYAESTPMVGREHTIKSGVVGPRHTIKSKVYAGGTP